ncbi:adenylate cyclase [Aureimonas endophytica]|uniref:Adenylate cyclase n=1 Tax=Aureimonas endophytica TaxID=2027858 RepID=A0A916ZH02_9HYPH|nr:adenylate/guanylate cyclase domain-containing protein [Aureimonas endophytica]GGD97838.1 adenylate cyclase [Aureimonas endophytica]
MQLLPSTSERPAASVTGGAWPHRRSAILDWLMLETSGERFIDNILVQLCERLREAGVPIGRATLNFRIQHPQWFGASMRWRVGLVEAEIETYEHGTMDNVSYLTSPIKAVLAGAGEIRRRLDRPATGSDYDYPLYDELRDQGMTDYVAWPIEHTLGRRHVVTFAADRPGGFDEGDIGLLRDLLPALALVSEIRLKNRLARTLLETYVGPHASAEILAGAITRGSGATVGAAILICDLRDFTTISELWPRDDVIELLNGYFDAMSEPIERHGGEILKFVGDGLLAIFPLDRPNACLDLLHAVAEAQAAMALLNEDHVRRGRKPLGYGIGIHVGDVMYGNIGSRRRLDFTVIGPAVNTAARLEALTKEVGRPVLVSKAFAEMAGCQKVLESLGAFPLKGIGGPIEVFAFSGDRCRAKVEEPGEALAEAALPA